MSIEERDFLVRQVEQRILGMPDVEYLYAKTGGVGSGAEDKIGSLTLNFVDWTVRQSADEILAEIRERTSDLVGIRIETRKPDSGPPQGKPVHIEFASRFPDLLERAVISVRERMQRQPGIVNVEDTSTASGH